jgi:hypothetical protein
MKISFVDPDSRPLIPECYFRTKPSCPARGVTPRCMKIGLAKIDLEPYSRIKRPCRDSHFFALNNPEKTFPSEMSPPGKKSMTTVRRIP